MLGLKPRKLPISWKSTIKLPQSKFPPRGPSPADRDRYLRKCTDDLYAWQKQKRIGAGYVILHDGPPYANGDLHIGHALNKILKDITCRYSMTKGLKVNYVPGWDCHGLPIELKALEKGKLQAHLREGSLAEDIPKRALKIRAAARELAASTIQQQKKTFREWGVMADWENPWTTMDSGFEIEQLKVFRDMVKRGLIYRQRKPVYWSPSSRTALAEAELEYRDDHVSQAAFVKFPLNQSLGSVSALSGSSSPIFALCWTTTPWTIPANRAIGYHKDLIYLIVEDKQKNRLLVAESRLSYIKSHLGEELSVLESLKGAELAGKTFDDGIFDQSSNSRPLIHADFVSAASGTGLVHLAPGHGMDDYTLCLQNSIPAFAPVDEDGRFTASASPVEPEMLNGLQVLSDGNQIVLDCLAAAGRLAGRHEYIHKYPYDWRSKQPAILRATEQWFANVSGVQERALKALQSSRFHPESGRARLESFVKNRHEWCISRQRAWGVPIPALYHNVTGEAVLTMESVSHVISILAERGTDAWWRDNALDPIWTPPNLRDAGGRTQYRRGYDTMDVWFDSGTSWTQMSLPDQAYKQEVGVPPANFYLEGTDQHRGWFQSSLLTFVACHDETATPYAPFQNLITHGFVLDANGHKMSKSLGNVISPNEIIEGTLLPSTTKKIKGKMLNIRDSMGPDALRLWVASNDYTKDIAVSPAALKLINNTLRKYRLTFKLLLGITHDFEVLHLEKHPKIGPVHKIALWQLKKTFRSVQESYDSFEYHKAVLEINRYINQDLSAFYFECIKDAAYCGVSSERFMVQAMCSKIYQTLQFMLAPITPLLIQETLEYAPEIIRLNHELSSERPDLIDIHFSPIPELELSDEESSTIAKDTPVLMELLGAVQGAQEEVRTAKKLGSSLQSFVTLDVKPGTAADVLMRYKDDLETLLVVSKVEVCLNGVSHRVFESGWSLKSDIILDGCDVSVYVHEPQLDKCVRCYRYAASISEEAMESLCERCEGVVEQVRNEIPILPKDQIKA